MSAGTLEAVRKSIVVAAPVELAWTVFTERIAEWWPLERHSIDAVKAVVEPDRIYEVQQDGAEVTWGRIHTWEPPHRLAFTWEVQRAASTEVEITFEADADGTRVELVHAGFTAEPVRASYDDGWDFVLGKYAQAAS